MESWRKIRLRLQVDDALNTKREEGDFPSGFVARTGDVVAFDPKLDQMRTRKRRSVIDHNACCKLSLIRWEISLLWSATPVAALYPLTPISDGTCL